MSSLVYVYNKNIVNLWKQHFHDLFNYVNNSSVKNLPFYVSYDTSIKVLPEETRVIRDLDCIKSCDLSMINVTSHMT